MVVTLEQQYHVGEKPTVILYTYIINRRPGTQKKQRKNKIKSASNMVVIIYCYIGCEDEVTTLKREQRGPMMHVDIFNVIQEEVQDTVIHLEVDEE